MTRHLRLCAGIAAAVLSAAAQTAPAPAFDVAYRAWDVVTSTARHNHDAALGGVCAKTFRPFVIAGLRRQTKEDEAIASTACVDAARRICANGKLPRTAEIEAKCREFR